MNEREALAELVALKDLKDRLHKLHEMGHGTDYDDYHRRQPLAWAAARTALSQPAVPVDMVLYCPACGLQHIDAPDLCPECPGGACMCVKQGEKWTNPPHRSHLCSRCGHIWRPADVPTNGVAAIKTKSKADSAALAQPAVREPLTGPELPQPSLLVESAQGFVEGWTRSQVRSAINLALLKQRYSQPAVPAPTTQVPVAWHKMARVWIGGDVFEDRWVACSEDSAGAEPLYAQSTQSAKEKQA